MIDSAEKAKAVDLVCNKARAYKLRDQYVTVKVYCTQEEGDILRKYFRGSYYPRKCEVMWVASSRLDLLAMAGAIEPHIGDGGRKRLRLLFDMANQFTSQVAMI